MSRAGRKRKIGKREPAGRISRAGSKPADPTQVARAARERMGISKTDSGSELPGSAPGRLFLAERITRRQFDAAIIIANRYAAYARAIDAPRPPSAVDLHAVHGRSGASISPAAAAAASAAWEEIRSALVHANGAYRESTLYAAAYYVVVIDRDMPHLTGDLKIALNIVADLLRLPAEGLTDQADAA